MGFIVGGLGSSVLGAAARGGVRRQRRGGVGVRFCDLSEATQGCQAASQGFPCTAVIRRSFRAHWRLRFTGVNRVLCQVTCRVTRARAG